MRIWGHVLVGATLIVVSPLGLTAAGASPSHPGGVVDTCPEVLAGAPTGGVEKSTDPAPGSVVARGSDIEISLRWHPGRFAEPVLHKVLDCVTVDGHPVDGVSVQEREPVNDGEFTTRMTVPDGFADGTRLCDRGFVSGVLPNGGFGREKSNDVCFTVRGDTAVAAPVVTATPIAPLAAGPAEGTAAPPPPPDTMAPPAPVSAPVVALPGDTPTPPEGDTGAGPAGHGRPGTAVAGAGERRDRGATLPRTGTDIGPSLVVALALVAIGQGARQAARRRPA